MDCELLGLCIREIELLFFVSGVLACALTLACMVSPPTTNYPFPFSNAIATYVPNTIPSTQWKTSSIFRPMGISAHRFFVRDFLAFREDVATVLAAAAMAFLRP
jgi:hypothetical protein